MTEFGRGEWKGQRQRQKGLYPGQREALTRRLRGQSNLEISEAMGLSKQTVVSYLSGARIFLDANTVDDAVQIALLDGKIPFYRNEGDK